MRSLSGHSPEDGNAHVRLYSRPGNHLTHRFPLIVETLVSLRSRSCIIDGEAVACDDNGIALFNLVFVSAAMTKACFCMPST